ncbi:hypothetical protein AUJ77_02055 [Candidatus Nomurabacteria bacterium CG1_02_43_90]|uniref:5'-nucleotidase n=1 Tax=Candidatus Nomurabacteria bacterium CG1_02_43_90 TaxID=1805281 RepID=A0A1J4V705_9BACT|nr:MAG: hypothetical protein AUJ77_02055 [Candidatus Nomurabacteria bacterium CG1_02_43_90]
MKQEQTVIISNSQRVNTIKERIKKGGSIRLHVLTDFDRTLTTAFVDGKSVPSLISLLRDGNYLTPDYAKKAHALFNKYHPIEIDMAISHKEKEWAMEQWWRTHLQLLIDSGFNRSDLEKVVTGGGVKLREGFVSFVNILHAQNIPLVIMSSSGLGSESVALYLKQAGLLYDNVYIICNEYEWDEVGRAVGVREPIIHLLNKYEIAIQDYPIFEIVKDRKNVILLGDSIDDIGMVKGFAYENLLSVGFLNDTTNECLAYYTDVFDVVLTGDTSFDFPNQLLEEIII